MSVVQRKNPVIDVTQSQLDQILGALCQLGIITARDLEARSVTILGPHTALVTKKCDCAEATSLNDTKAEIVEDNPPCRLCGSTTCVVEERWYAVIRGLEVGVFQGWSTAQTLLQLPDNPSTAISGSFSKVFGSHKDAVDFFNDARAAGQVAKLSLRQVD